MNLIKILTFYLPIITQSFYFSQINLFQETWRGGVKCVSFSVGQGAGETNLDLSLPVGSKLKNIYLIVDSQRVPDSTGISINDLIIPLDSLKIITQVLTASPYASPTTLYYYEMTNFFTSNLVNFSNFNLKNYSTCFEILNCGFSLCTFVLLYENLTLPPLNLTILIPNKNLFGQENYFVQNINPIDTNYPVGFSINMTRSCNPTDDGSVVYLNSNLLGVIGGDDLGNIASCSGSQGQFIYENQNLIALSDDNIDLQMQGTDALSNIQSIINNNSTSFALTLNHNLPNGSASKKNVYNNFLLAYSTPCDTFSVTVNKDTTICPGASVQLSASGGQSYLWQSSTGVASMDLSCTTCPNPVFSGDSSRLFTVQIWNNDSCSVIRPVLVKVRKKPVLGTFVLQKPDCGANNGVLSITTNKDSIVSFQLDNLPIENTASWSNLSTGVHTIFYTDKFGCSGDSSFVIADTIRTKALFTATPSYGYLPLNVDFVNKSKNALFYEWSVNNELFGANLSNFTFDTSGVYTVSLKAWQNDVSCADSFSLKITVYDHFIFKIPNIFTVNNDGVNDEFGIQTNANVSITYSIFNRWGEEMISGTVTNATDLGKGEQFYSLWDGSSRVSALNGKNQEVTGGVYFYRLSIELREELFLPAFELDKEHKTQKFPIVEEGWVQVVSQ